MYRVVLRASSGASGGVGRLEFVSGGPPIWFNVRGTGGWGNFTNVASSAFTLPAGTQVMRFTVAQAYFDLDAIEIVPVVVPPLVASAVITPCTGAAQLHFTGEPGASYTILGSTNAALPQAWTVLGPAVEVAPGVYRFTDSAPAMQPQMFYRVRAIQN